jgi:hypothetical protein
VWTTAPKAAFESLLECIEFYEGKEADATYQNMYSGDLTGQALTPEQKKLLKFFEGEFVCSGLCRPNMFYVSLSIKLGRPT